RKRLTGVKGPLAARCADLDNGMSAMTVSPVTFYAEKKDKSPTSLSVRPKQDAQSLLSCFSIRHRQLTRSCQDSIDLLCWSIECLSWRSLPKDGVLDLRMNQFANLFPLGYDRHQDRVTNKRREKADRVLHRHGFTRPGCQVIVRNVFANLGAGEIVSQIHRRFQPVFIVNFGNRDQTNATGRDRFAKPSNRHRLDG